MLFWCICAVPFAAVQCYITSSLGDITASIAFRSKFQLANPAVVRWDLVDGASPQLMRFG